MRNDHVEISALRSADQETFERRGYLLLPALLDSALTDFLWSYVQTKFACQLLLLSGDNAQVPNVLCDYGDPAFDGLLEYLRPRVEEYSGLRLLPTYSLFRLYRQGDI